MRWITGIVIALLVVGAGAAALYRVRTEERSIEIEAPPKAVWDVLIDFGSYPQWNPFIRTATAPSGVEPGRKLDVRITNGGSETGFSPTVLATVPERELRWLGRVVLPRVLDGEHAFRLEATPTGTRLTQSETFRGVLVPIAGSAIDVGDSFDAMNRALRDRVLATIAR